MLGRLASGNHSSHQFQTVDLEVSSVAQPQCQVAALDCSRNGHYLNTGLHGSDTEHQSHQPKAHLQKQTGVLSLQVAKYS